MRKTVAYAFHHSIPILIGFFPVGLAYGLLMQQAGYNFLWSGACSLFVLAGSLQFLMVTFFAGGVSLATVAVLALLLNSRHIFYGLSFIDKFRSFGPWRWFLIYSLCDENYSLHCSHEHRRAAAARAGQVPAAVAARDGRGAHAAAPGARAEVCRRRCAGMTLSVGQSIAIIAVCAACTFLERWLPWLLFGRRAVPKVVEYLGKILPMAVMVSLLVYCLRGMQFTSAGAWVPQVIAVGVTAGLHWWRRNTLLSIAAGTVCYMLLVQLVF